MTDLTAEQWIATRGISLEVAEACGLGETVTPQLDVHPSMDYLDGYPCVVIPYFNADGSRMTVDGVPFARVRRLGELAKGTPKYTQGAGTGVHVYLPPILDWEAIFNDPKIPIVITEGEAKAIALCAQGIACIALGGVSSIRDTQTGEFMPGTKGCKWGKRETFVCFDSDIIDPKKVELRAAQERLRYELSVGLNADVKIITLPGKPTGFDEDGKPLPDEKVGLDDFLLWQGFGQFMILMNAAPDMSRLDKEVLLMNGHVALVNAQQAAFEFAKNEFVPTSWLKEGHDLSARRFVVTGMGKKGPIEKEIVVAKEWLVHPNATRIDDVVFKPGQDKHIVGPNGERFYNRWNGFNAAPGNVAPFLELTDFMMSGVEKEHRDFAIKLLAYKAQNPGFKIPIAIFMVGEQGSGKSLWCEMVLKAFGPHTTAMNSKALRSDFNGWLATSIVIQIDEVTPDFLKEEGDYLKTLVAAPHMTVNEKFIKARDCDTPGLYLMTSNHQEAASFEEKERRYFVVGTPNMMLGAPGADFYGRMFAFKDDPASGPAIMDYLLNYDLQGWVPPSKAPVTGERATAQREGLDPISALAYAMKTADENVVKLWIEASYQWSLDVLSNFPSNGPLNLLKKAQTVKQVMPQFPVRPFYSMSEMGLLFSDLSEQQMGNRAGKYRNYTPEQISSGLRHAGVKRLRCVDNVDGFRFNNKIEPFLIVANMEPLVDAGIISRDELENGLTQDKFESLMLMFDNYNQLPGAKLGAGFKGA